MLKKTHLALAASLLLASPMAFSQSLPYPPLPDFVQGRHDYQSPTPRDFAGDPCSPNLGAVSPVDENGPSHRGPYVAGPGATANCNLALAVGPATFAQDNFASAFGTSAFASGYGASAFGSQSVAHGDFNLANGLGARAVFGNYNTALGTVAVAGGGDFNTASGNNAHAIGDYNPANGTGAFAYGTRNTSIGTGAGSETRDATAIGALSRAAAPGCVALGAGSVCDEANTVSVGHDDNQRRIVNVADGVEDTDAATVGQMNQADQHWYNQAISYVDLRIGDRVDLSDVYNRLDALDGRVDGLDRAVASLGTRLDKLGAMSAAQAALAASGVAAQGGKGSVGMAVGSYNGQQAAALGYSKAFRLSSGRPVGVTLQAAFSGETSVGAAVSIGLR